MNRRGFCKSLAMAPVAAVAVSVGVKAASVGVKAAMPLFHTGNMTLPYGDFYDCPLRYAAHGHRGSWEMYPHQREMLRMMQESERRVLNWQRGGGKVTRIHDEIIFS